VITLFDSLEAHVVYSGEALKNIAFRFDEPDEGVVVNTLKKHLINGRRTDEKRFAHQVICKPF